MSEAPRFEKKPLNSRPFSPDFPPEEVIRNDHELDIARYLMSQGMQVIHEPHEIVDRARQVSSGVYHSAKPDFWVYADDPDQGKYVEVTKQKHKKWGKRKRMQGKIMKEYQESSGTPYIFICADTLAQFITAFVESEKRIQREAVFAS